MDVGINSQTNVALIRKLHGSLMCLAYVVDMLSMGVCATRHWGMSVQLVQELNVCTVILSYFFYHYREDMSGVAGRLSKNLLLRLNLADAPHFYNLASLEATLQCLLHVTARSVGE